MGRLVLWDIDGTLVRTGEIGAVVFDRAIEKVLGFSPTDRVRMSGKTDPQIVLEYLALAERADADHHLPAILTQLERELAAEAHQIGAHGTVLPGVTQLLPRLAGDDEMDQTVLTGNIEGNAWLKLAAFGLDRWLNLPMGAYGSDHADRTRLVPVALDKVAAARGRRYELDEVWVVGDSPNDLACARAGGVRCLLVATGRSTYDELRSRRPDALRRDLGAVDDVLDLLRS